MLDVGREAHAGKWEKEVGTSTLLQWGFLWQCLSGEWEQLTEGTEATKELLWLHGKNTNLKRLPATSSFCTPFISIATGHPEPGSLKKAFGLGG